MKFKIIFLMLAWPFMAWTQIKKGKDLFLKQTNSGTAAGGEFQF